ncbi:glycosyltransferase family 1 protein [Sphingobacterium faecium]|uniref:glycosyltransferase family 4 protein n=1 Tax=Sphingobacterium faecium TaxID=34087 RepID=UPI00320939EE
MGKILMNGLLLKNKHSGVQYSIENLIAALQRLDLKEHAIEILISEKYEGPLLHSGNVKLKRIQHKLHNRFSRIYYEHIVIPSYLKEKGFDLYHSPSYILPYFSQFKSVVTVHDLIALDFPNLCQNETAAYFKLTLSRSIQKANHIITVSQKVKNDILNRFPDISEEKIQVIYPGLKANFSPVTDLSVRENIKNRYALPDQYFLFVGNLEPKKNITLIIQAFTRLKGIRLCAHKLVIVGQLGWKYDSILNDINQSRFREDIILLGYIDEEHLPALYAMAAIFLFPSLYEGFGIPALEAMACGCPVIISNRGALPEVTGGAAYQIDPYDIDSLISAILLLLDDGSLRANMIQEGLLWSKNFTWQKTAIETFELYQSLL